MKIAINNTRKIYALQEEFSSEFPGLTLAFHAKASKQDGAPSEKLVHHSSKSLQECRTIHNEGTVEILPSMRIAEVKDVFRDIFGLSVEILLKGENGTTSETENEKFTLDEINTAQPVQV